MKENHAAAEELMAVLNELQRIITVHARNQRILDIWNESQGYVHDRAA